MPQYVYLTCCVDSTAEDIDKMTASAVEIRYRTFRKHCNPFECEAMRHYEKDPRQGLTLKNDWHVRYFRSSYQGRACYYIKHSAIEYIWTLQEADNGRSLEGRRVQSSGSASLRGARETSGTGPRTWTTPASQAWGVRD